MVTGRPFMISNSSMKSERCIGSSLASAVRRPPSAAGQDHLAHGGDAVAVKEHVLGAAKADALGAEGARGAGIGGVSALVRTFMRRVASAHSMIRPKSPDSSGCSMATAPLST
jgi:hypothetical protein